MSRAVVRLTVDHLRALPAPCRSCVFWQCDPVRRGRVDGASEGAADGSAAETEVEAWLSHVLREWGSCGRVVLIDGEPVAHALYAPEAFLPGTAGFPTAPVTPDAIVLAQVWVDPAHRAGGLGRLLVQHTARDLIGRGFAAVEAFGDTRGNTTRACVLPAEFLSSVGFRTQRAHSTTPRMRMELRAAVTWRDEVSAAWERLAGAVRPAPARAPGGAPTRAPTRSVGRSARGSLGVPRGSG